ncbi:MAG: NAD(P)-binding domain-containing protein, partial [Bacillus sp. (in: firmicutes)]
MAEAMISGIVKEGVIPPNQITVTNQSNIDRLKQLENRYQITGVKKDELKFTEYDLIILAMKPKDAQTSLLTISDRLQHHQLIISVLAGVSTQFMEQHLPSEQQVIRVMPNTSSMIGESATGICSGTWTT